MAAPPSYNEATGSNGNIFDKITHSSRSHGDLVPDHERDSIVVSSTNPNQWGKPSTAEGDPETQPKPSTWGFAPDTRADAGASGTTNEGQATGTGGTNSTGPVALQVDSNKNYEDDEPYDCEDCCDDCFDCLTNPWCCCLCVLIFLFLIVGLPIILCTRPNARCSSSSSGGTWRSSAVYRSGGGSCFLTGTKIALNDATALNLHRPEEYLQQKYVSIENIRVNDRIGWDLEVTAVHSFRYFLDDNDLCVYKRINDELLVSADHMVFEDGKWIYVENSKFARCLSLDEASARVKKMNIPVFVDKKTNKEWVVLYNLDTTKHVLPLQYDFYHPNMTHARRNSLPLFSDFVLLDEETSPKAFEKIAEIERKELNKRAKKWL